MQAALLLILIVIGNLSLYWFFFGKQKFEQKMKEASECQNKS